jgi:hypothetical protein
MLRMRFAVLLALSLAACSSSAPATDLAADARSDDARPDAPQVRDAAADHLAADRAASDGPSHDLRPPDLPVPDSKPPLPSLPVLILAGQSNMVGLGYNAELSAADKAPVASTTIYYNDSVHPNPNTLKWMPLAPGFGVLADRFGPELSFGRRLRQLWPKPPLAIIKVAEGGTALHDRWAAKTGDLYKLLVAEVKAQLAVLNKTAQAQPVAVVWMQGESDGIKASYAGAYQANLTAFVGALRQELGLPGLPFTAGLISLRPEWPYATTVRAGTIAAIPALAPMNVVETADLPTHAADPVHYSSASNLALGRRFANATASHHATGWDFALGFSPVQGSAGWGYRDRLAATSSAMSWDPKQNRWTGGEAGVLIGDGWMHPGPTRAAELTWTSPIAGPISVELTVASADNTGGDGTVVEVALGAATVFGPTPIAKKSTVKQSLKLSVQKGSLLQLRTSSGPAGDPSHDTTSWQVAITPGP